MKNINKMERLKKLYKRGARKEYYLKEQLKRAGYDIVQRSAGSHSPIDLIGIHIKDRVIMLIQSKRVTKEVMGYTDPRLKEKIEEEFKDLNGTYKVIFEVK